MDGYTGVKVHTVTKDLPLSQLKDMCDANDIITNPDYQRNYIYNAKRASSLIESILLGIPIPVVYLSEEENGTYSVIDGQQRITSFVNYLKNEYRLTGLTELSQLNGKYFKDLEKDVQRKLNFSSLKAICLDKDSQELKYEIFSRLNQGSISLRPQELRNCIYRGSFNTMLKDIAQNNKLLPLLFHDQNTRSSHEERILRFFVLRDSMILNTTYVNAMNQYMETHQNDSDTDIHKAKILFNGTIDIVKQILGEDAFFSCGSKKRKKFNGAVYDSIMIPFSFYEKAELIAKADIIRTKIVNIKMTDKEYQENVYAGTNARPKVFARIGKIWDLLIHITGKNGMNPENRIFENNMKQQLFHSGYLCSYCGNEILQYEDCEIDHIIPFSLDGSTDISDAQLLHHSCHQRKNSRLL
ncbi:MAG: DUF262 domain-containing protein [Clostridia bacterium]|nr:DUF262 domain-containing protein [Clostridia bacterium]